MIINMNGGSTGCTLTVTAPAGVTAKVTTDFNRIHTVNSKTENGLTFTVNSDKSITINGTATSDTWLSLVGSEGLYPAAKFNGFIYSAGVDLTGTGVQIFYNQRDSSENFVGSGYFYDTVDRYVLQKTDENTVYFALGVRVLSGTTLNNFTIDNSLLPANPKTKTKQIGEDGIAVFKGLATGDWKVSITDGENTAHKIVAITTDYDAVMSFSTIPDFTYTGDFEIINDSDEPITTSQDNWKIRFLTSGTLKFTNLNGAENGIDVFLVGGGGGNMYHADANVFGGAGGGYTKTEKGVSVDKDITYDITIGAGGAGTSGGTTSAFGYSASGGETGGTGTHNNGTYKGGDGGSGGGGSSTTGTPAAGGSDGGNGGDSLSSGGTGQGTTTREFGDPSGKLYAGGGGGYNENGNSAAGGDGGGAAGGSSASANTGGGAGGNYRFQLSGGSGIVIIRNAREVS